MPATAKNHASGFTLVETLITTVALTVAAFGIMSLLISTQYTAEDSLYESTALTVALSTLEQMKSMPASDLEDAMTNSTFNLITGIDDTTGAMERTALDLVSPNVDLPIPIVTNGTSPKNMLLTLTPSIHALADNNGFWLRVEYAYDHPRNNRTRTKVIGAVRARFRAFPLSIQ